MSFIHALFVLCVILQYSSQSWAENKPKPKPLDLAWSCMSVHAHEGNQKAPILLLHGLGFSKESWMGIYQVLAFATKRRVCRADLRNHGDSPWSDESDIEAMSADLPHLLSKLKIPKVIVLGHSLGGKVAVHFTLNNPDKVEKLIVEDMRPNGITLLALLEIKGFLTLLQTAITAVPEGASEKEAKIAVTDFMNENLAKLNVSYLGREFADALPIKCSNGKCDWKTNTELITKVLKDPLSFLTKSSGRFDGPTLFLYGTKSALKVKEDESSILKMFPKAKLIGVEGAGHLLHDRPEFMNSVIKFINASE